MSVKHAFLGLLAEGPLHGYELKQSFEERLLPSSPLNYGQVYGSLERLERDGLVEHQVIVQEERPDKKVYRVTAEGLRELDRWLRNPSVPALDLRNETFLKLAVSRRLGDVDTAEVLASERRGSFRRLREVTEARRQAAAEGKGVELLLLLDLAAFRLEAFLKWLERCEELFDQEARRNGNGDAEEA